MQRVFTSLNTRVMPRKLLPRTDGLLDIMQHALENAAIRHHNVQLCRLSDIQVSISLAYILCIASLEEAFGCEKDASPQQSCGIQQSSGQMQQIVYKLHRSFHDAGYSVDKFNSFSSANGELNFTVSVCATLMISMQSLLQCSIPTAELLARASFVLRLCRAPLAMWAGLVQRAVHICAPDSQSSEFERDDQVIQCSASTAVRVASEHLALKLELFKQKTSASKFHRKGAQYGTLGHFVSKNDHPKLADLFTVHIMGTTTSAPILQSYRDILRSQDIVHVDLPMKGSCLVAATRVATMLYAPFIALGKWPSFVMAFDCDVIAYNISECIMIAAGTEHDHELLLAQGLLSVDAWNTIKAACLYIDVIDNMSSMKRSQVSPCHDVILRFASDYDVIICDDALVVDT
jgi:hypothetical protein